MQTGDVVAIHFASEFGAVTGLGRLVSWTVEPYAPATVTVLASRVASRHPYWVDMWAPGQQRLISLTNDCRTKVPFTLWVEI